MIRSRNLIIKNPLNYVYVFLLCLNICTRIISGSNLNTFVFIDKTIWNAILVRISIIICLIMFLLNNKKQSKRNFFIMMIVAFLVLIITIFSSNLSFLQIFCFIIAYPQKLNSRKVAQCESISFIVTTLFVFIMYKLDFIIGYVELRNGDAIRNSCGFVSANTFSNIILISLINYVYYKQEKWNIKTSCIWVIWVLYIYSITNSRMAFALEIFLIIIMTINIFRKRDSKSNLLYNVSGISYFIGFFISVVITVLYSNGYFNHILTKLNEFLTYRLSYTSKYLANPGISLFGQTLVFVSQAKSLLTGEKWSGLDNGYIYILVSWGIVGTVIFSVLMYKLSKYLKEQNNYYGALCFLAMSIIGLTENYITLVTYNLLIILVAEMIANRNTIKVE